MMRLNVWLMCLVCLTGLWCAQTAYGDIPPEIDAADEQRLTVAFFPQPIPIYLYKNVPPKANVDVAALRRVMMVQAGKHPYLRVLSPSDVETRFNHDELRQADSFMQAEIEMGYAGNFMESMNYSSASEVIRRAISNYQKSFVQYYRPQKVAQAWQMLAYALIAQHQELDDAADVKLEPAKLAFVELIRLAPYLTMLEGRQSPERVKLYDEALELFMGDPLYRQTSQKDAAALCQRLDVNMLVMSRIVEDRTGSLFLELDIYQADGDRMTYLRRELDMPDEDQDAYVADMASLMLTNIYDCVRVETPVQAADVRRGKAKRFALEAGMSYASHMRHPTEDFLQNLGGHLSLSYMFDEHFFIQAQAEIFAVLQDRARELYDSFEIYQFPVHVGLAKDWPFARIYLALGMIIGFSSSYTIVRSTACKTFGTDDVECNPKDISTNHGPLQLLIDFVFGSGFGKDPFYLTLEGTVSLTVWPTDSGDFKHMIGARLGVQYWF